MERETQRRRTIDGAEADWVCKSWRRVTSWNSRTGKWIKGKMNRRERRSANVEIEEQRNADT